jgi:hypothetical protein
MAWIIVIMVGHVWTVIEDRLSSTLIFRHGLAYPG